MLLLRGKIVPRVCPPRVPQAFVALCNEFPAQIVALAAQVSWSSSTLMALKTGGAAAGGGLQACLDGLAWRLLAMSESVLGESPPALRKKYEQLITELVRQRDATRRLQVGLAFSPVQVSSPAPTRSQQVQVHLSFVFKGMQPTRGDGEKRDVIGG